MNLELVAIVVTIVNLVIVVAGIVGCYVAFRGGLARALQEAQQRMIDTLHAENEILMNRGKRLESEKKQLKSDMLLAAAALKKTRGITLEVEEGVVTIRGKDGTTVQVLSQLSSVDGQQSEN